MVESLKAGLTAGTMLAQIQGIVRVPLNLLGASLHHPDQEAIRGGALATEGGIEGVSALHQVLRQQDWALDRELLGPDDAAGKEDRSQAQA
jgi:hypothetical protein